MRPRALCAALALLAGGPAAAALPDERAVTERLLVIGIADQLRKECGGVEARMLRAYAHLRETAGIALSLGYDRATIEAYVEDRAHKERLRAVARDRLAARGAAPGDEAAHCRLARAEISAGSAVGRLLRD